jgi:phenylalanyl-tRNA synthetase alpha chain
MAQDIDIAALERALIAEIGAAGDLKLLEEARISALGRKGRVAELMGRLGALPADQRKSFGQAVNGLKQRVSEALEGRRAELDRAQLRARLASERADISLPVRLGPQQEGRIHPVSQVFDEVAEIFGDMGFAIAEGPDIETDDFNFTKLNIPPEHPARQDHDTFYFQPKPDGTRLLLRTHTSPVQIRTMLAQKPPLRIIVPGRVYRIDSDATHTPMFHQIEGLVIDESTHLGHLKWCLEEFCKAFFEVDEVRMRFRASHFPFTEPSMEVDIDAAAIGKPGQWLEILGSGMVHPAVFEAVGYDPDKVTGFAFGMGMERVAMLKYGVDDIRLFYENDLRFLEQFPV